MRLILAILLALLTSPAFCDDLMDALDNLCLPSGYRFEASIQISGTETVLGSREARVAVSSDWVRIEHHQVIEGVGKNLIDIRIGAEGATWIWNPPSFTIRRNGDFAQRRIIAGETDFSPIGVVRALRAVKTEGSESVLDPNTGAKTYRVMIVNQNRSGPVEIDIQNGRITSYRASFVGGRFYSQTTYEEWIELPDGSCVPTRIVSESFSGSSDEPAIRNTVSVRDIRIIPPTTPPPSVSVPPEYTLIDEIEGVTKKSDGTVIAPIHYPDDQDPSNGRGAAGPKLNVILLASGVVLVILAGLIWRKKSLGGS